MAYPPLPRGVSVARTPKKTPDSTSYDIPVVRLLLLFQPDRRGNRKLPHSGYSPRMFVIRPGVTTREPQVPLKPDLRQLIRQRTSRRKFCWVHSTRSITRIIPESIRLFVTDLPSPRHGITLAIEVSEKASEQEERGVHVYSWPGRTADEVCVKYLFKCADAGGLAKVTVAI